MPRNSTQHIYHTFSGGWATDYGPTFYGSPEAGQMRLPWLNQAENLLFTRDGGIEKWRGVNRHTSNHILKDFVLGETAIKAITDYWRSGSFPTQKIVAAVGGSFFDVGEGSSSLIGVNSTLSNTTAPAHFSTFNDLLIMGMEGMSPNSWDQTTFQTLAGTPPNFWFSTPHRGRHWASGNSSALSRLYYSAVGNPEDWVGAGSGSIDIDPGDGDAIVGMMSWKNELFVFKGPNRLSIHRISGSSPTDFTRNTFVTGISASGPQAIFQYGNDIGFWSPRGSCHSLTATDTYGDYIQSFINYPILSWCQDSSNISKGDNTIQWQAVTNPTEGYTLFNYSDRNAPYRTNNTCLMMDWKFLNQGEQYPRFSRLTSVQPSTIGIILDSTQNTVYFGDQGGVIYRSKVESPPHRQGATYTTALPQTGFKAIPLRLETPYLTYGPDIETKTVNNFSLTLSTAHRSTVTVKWGGTKWPKQTTTIAQPGYTPLGTFVLGTDVLGVLGYQPVFCQDLSGDFRSIQYNIIEDSAIGSVTPFDGAGLTLMTFGVSLAPTGESTEG